MQARTERHPRKSGVRKARVLPVANDWPVMSTNSRRSGSTGLGLDLDLDLDLGLGTAKLWLAAAKRDLMPQSYYHERQRRNQARRSQPVRHRARDV